MNEKTILIVGAVGAALVVLYLMMSGKSLASISPTLGLTKPTAPVVQASVTKTTTPGTGLTAVGAAVSGTVGALAGTAAKLPTQTGCNQCLSQCAAGLCQTPAPCNLGLTGFCNVVIPECLETPCFTAGIQCLSAGGPCAWTD
jgi:hypothetical protein